jgi:hypothetical protein
MTDARDSGTDVQRYEQLRSHAPDGEPFGFRLGLALLERRGIAAGARAWGDTSALRPRRGKCVRRACSRSYGRRWASTGSFDRR